MGGIAGFIRFNGDVLGDIAGMLKSIGHRSQDPAEFYQENLVQLGTCGASHFALAGGSIVCGFSGVLYNHQALVRKFNEKGSINPDCYPAELILRLYEAMGRDFLSALEGQFSLVICDGKEGMVLLARDTFGISPLFYSITANALIFASEIKAIFRSGAVAITPNIKGLYEGFVYWSTGGNRTVFENIHQVPPGCWVAIGRNKEVSIHPFYHHEGTALQQNNLQEIIYSTLSEAMLSSLGDPRNSGLFVSGGLDSTILLKLAQKLGYSDIPVFSLGFADSALDESAFQDLALKGHEGTHHRVVAADRDVLALLPQVLRHCETPLFKLGPVPMFMLAQVSKEAGVEQVICGEGADELFYGYDIFKETQYRSNLARNPDSSQYTRDIEHIVPPQYRNNPSILAMYSKFYHPFLTGEEDVLYSMRPRIGSSSCIAKYFSQDNRAEILPEEIDCLVADQFTPRPSPLRQCQEVQIQVLLAGYLLASQGDRALMANSIKGRYPFLDKRMWELSLSIPDSLKLAGYQEKYILKQTFAPLIPAPILQRRKYQFSAPSATRFFKHEDVIAPYLTKEAFESCGVFDYNLVQPLIQSLKSGQAPPHQTISEEMMFTYILTTHMLLAHV